MAFFLPQDDTAPGITGVSGREGTEVDSGVQEER